MPGRFIGSTKIMGRYRGAQPVLTRYLGSTLVWSNERIFIPFDGPNIDLEDTGDWVDLGGSTDYKAATYNGSMRLDLPDGLVVQTNRTSRARYDTTHPGDDGYIEIRPATKGNGSPPLSGANYTTDAFRRGNNSGSSATHGVGIRLRESKLSIVRNVSGVALEMVQCGSFAANDHIRLRQVGNLHSMYRNGTFVGEWNDSSATAQKGASYRSIIVRADASKDFLGPRRFSPAIDYIECS